MGVGYDKIDRPAAAARNILVCNVPDYGTTEVADHAMALVLTLRRGVVLYHERLRASRSAPWGVVKNDLIRRLGVQTFGIIGLGRIGTAVALRARAFGFRVVFYDPYLPNGADLALGIGRAATLEDLLRQTDTLSVHAPLTPETRNMLGRDQLALLRPGAVVVNAARGPIIDPDALLALLRSGHIAAAGLDVLPVEPPVEPFPEILRAYREREPALEGRLVITPHAAWFTPESEHDTRVKSAETMRAALLTNRPQNVIAPQMPGPAVCGFLRCFRERLIDEFLCGRVDRRAGRRHGLQWRKALRFSALLLRLPIGPSRRRSGPMPFRYNRCLPRLSPRHKP